MVSWQLLDKVKHTAVAVVGLLVILSSVASIVDVLATVFEALQFIQCTHAHTPAPPQLRPLAPAPCCGASQTCGMRSSACC